MLKVVRSVKAENKATILDDPFIKAYIDDVLRSLRTQYLIDLIKPYTRMELKWLGRVSCSLFHRLDIRVLKSVGGPVGVEHDLATERFGGASGGSVGRVDLGREGQGKD